MPWYTHARFSENCAYVLNEWFLTINDDVAHD